MQSDVMMRKIEIDAAHRVPHHSSKCFNVHGHRYVIEAYCSGAILADSNQNGMIMDFGFLKQVMTETIYDICDHATIWWEQDPLLYQNGGDVNIFQPGFKNCVIPEVPTAENLAKLWHEWVQRGIEAFFDKEYPQVANAPHLDCLRVWETPNCFAEHREVAPTWIAVDPGYDPTKKGPACSQD